jgi:hypothetical protein
MIYLFVAVKMSYEFTQATILEQMEESGRKGSQCKACKSKVHKGFGLRTTTSVSRVFCRILGPRHAPVMASYEEISQGRDIFMVDTGRLEYSYPGHPVRSGILKFRTVRLVLGWVTTGEYWLLYVLHVSPLSSSIKYFDFSWKNLLYYYVTFFQRGKDFSSTPAFEIWLHK